MNALLHSALLLPNLHPLLMIQLSHHTSNSAGSMTLLSLPHQILSHSMSFGCLPIFFLHLWTVISPESVTSSKKNFLTFARFDDHVYCSELSLAANVVTTIPSTGNNLSRVMISTLPSSAITFLPNMTTNFSLLSSILVLRLCNVSANLFGLMFQSFSLTTPLLCATLCTCLPTLSNTLSLSQNRINLVMEIKFLCDTLPMMMTA